MPFPASECIMGKNQRSILQSRECLRTILNRLVTSEMEDVLKVEGQNGRNRDALPRRKDTHGFERAHFLGVTKD